MLLTTPPMYGSGGAVVVVVCAGTSLSAPAAAHFGETTPRRRWTRSSRNDEKRGCWDHEMGGEGTDARGAEGYEEGHGGGGAKVTIDGDVSRR